MRVAWFPWLFLVSTAASGCGPAPAADAGDGDAGAPDGGAHDAGAVDGGDDAGSVLVDAGPDDGGADAGAEPCELTVTIGGAGLSYDILPGVPIGGHCTVTLVSIGPDTELIDVYAPDASLTLQADTENPALQERESGFLGPFVIKASETRSIDAVRVRGSPGGLGVGVRRYGLIASEVIAARSLVWTDAALVDDPLTVGLSRVMAAMSDDGHGGRLLRHWFETFGTTAHSSRAGPGLIVEEHALSHGDDAAAWDLDLLPFQVTGVHTRVDLKDASTCGQLRVSMASTHPVQRPFHLIFLFALTPSFGDATPSGALHCVGTAFRLARLSNKTGDYFLDAARALLDETLVPERFLLAESVEFTISPWEWRQWVKVPNTDVTMSDTLPFVVDNPPLFQTVDIPAVNAPGPKRDAFLSFVTANAPALAARSLLWPESFRAPSFRLNDGVPWVPVDLTGVDPSVLTSFPTLAGQIVITGCPACHQADAQFVHTREDRTFSPFYTKELVARAAFLDALQRGLELHVPFGPLQEDPVLP